MRCISITVLPSQAPPPKPKLIVLLRCIIDHNFYTRLSNMLCNHDVLRSMQSVLSYILIGHHFEPRGVIQTV